MPTTDPGKAPTYLLDTKWRIAKQLKNVPQWPGYVEVIKLEYDAQDHAGVVHIQAQPSGWTLRLTLSSFFTLMEKGAITPAN